MPLSAQHETAMVIPKCKEVNYMSEGHMLAVEAGDTVAREIINFWRFDAKGILS